MKSYICDCGHPESEHSEHTRGYGRDADGKTFCYECCTASDKEQLRTSNAVCQYISGDGKSLTNWPGFVLGRVLYWGKRHPFSRERRYVRVRDCHGQEWHGTGAEGMWASLRKCKPAA